MNTATLQDAAEARRSGGIAAPVDRPRQRRCAEDPAAPAYVRASVRGVQLRAAEGEGGLLTFEGYASVTESPYQMYDFFGPYNEIVSLGAFDESLARGDLDVPFVLGHDQLRRIARTTNGTLQLSADASGLHVLAPALDPNDHDVAYIAPKLRAGLIDEMSFAFRILSGKWSPDYSEYRIEKADLHRGDVAIVGYGANPATSAALRWQDRAHAARGADDAEVAAQLAAWSAESQRRNLVGMSYAQMLALTAE